MGSDSPLVKSSSIAFARVLLADPRILILDEATAAIDTHTEILIQQALERVLENRTLCDRSPSFNHSQGGSHHGGQSGKIIESGTHDELMAMKGQYYDLTAAQYTFLQSI